MSIVRGPRPESGWYALDKRISEDARLSWAARGLLIYLLGKPDNWRVNVSHLLQQTQGARVRTGRDGIYALLAELEEAGYVERRQERGADGRLLPMEYVVHENPPTASGSNVSGEATASGSAVSGSAVSGSAGRITKTDVQQELNIATSCGGLGRKKAEKPPEDPAWLEFRAIYPKRAGDPNVAGGRRCWSARLKEGHTAEQMLAGARRYAAFIRATGKDGTEFVQQYTRFLGPSKPFLLPWDPPAALEDPRRAAERERAQAAERREWEDLKVRASRCGFRDPHECESLPVYRTLVQRAEWEARDRAKGSPQGPVSVRAMLARLRQDMGKDGGEAAEGAG